MALFTPNYIDCVVAIGIENKKEKHWIGTGFFFGKLLEKTPDTKNIYTTYLVTNKHVLKGLDQIIIRFNPKTVESSKDYHVKLIIDNKPTWHSHPDPDIDVAVIRVNLHTPNNAGMKFKFFQSDKEVFTFNEMKENGVTEGDGVFVLGFPMGIVAEDRQYVFVRSGSIARIKDLYDLRSKDYVVDAFVFPGNSGGPVISKPEIASIKGTVFNSKSRLIGIIKSYIPYTDVAISRQTQMPRITFEENSGLSLVEPVDHILQAIEMDK